MAKARKAAVMNRLQAAARLSRTVLAARLNGHGFYAGQEQLMLALEHEGGLSPGALAIRLGVRPPTITKTINRLAAAGVLEKRASTSDARQTHIFLTDTGHEAIKALEKAVRKTEKQAFRGIDKKEQKALAKLLARVEANLAREADVDPVEDEEEDVELPEPAAAEADAETL